MYTFHSIMASRQLPMDSKCHGVTEFYLLSYDGTSNVVLPSGSNMISVRNYIRFVYSLFIL